MAKEEHKFVLDVAQKLGGFRPEDGDSKFLRNAGIYQRVYKGPQLRGKSSNNTFMITVIRIESPFL
jgi:hypothetical protein